MGTENLFEVEELEKEKGGFYKYSGLDIREFVKRKYSEGVVADYKDYQSFLGRPVRRFQLGNDMVYQKMQYPGEISAEVLLGYVYNKLGFPSVIAYPFFDRIFHAGAKNNLSKVPNIADGVITKDVLDVYPLADHRVDVDCLSIYDLFKSEECLKVITDKGRLNKLKEIILAMAVNDKDVGFDNALWVPNDDGKLEGIVAIDHGYSGRDSMYIADKDDFLRELYIRGERGFMGLISPLESRGTVMYYFKKLLSGDTLEGVQLPDDIIQKLKIFIEEISQIDFNKIAEDYKDKFGFEVNKRYVQNLNICREDFCGEMEKI